MPSFGVILCCGIQLIGGGILYLFIKREKKFIDILKSLKLYDINNTLKNDILSNNGCIEYAAIRGSTGYLNDDSKNCDDYGNLVTLCKKVERNLQINSYLGFINTMDQVDYKYSCSGFDLVPMAPDHLFHKMTGWCNNIRVEIVSPRYSRLLKSSLPNVLEIAIDSSDDTEFKGKYTEMYEFLKKIVKLLFGYILIDTKKTIESLSINTNTIAIGKISATKHSDRLVMQPYQNLPYIIIPGVVTLSDVQNRFIRNNVKRNLFYLLCVSFSFTLFYLLNELYDDYMNHCRFRGLELSAVLTPDDVQNTPATSNLADINIIESQKCLICCTNYPNVLILNCRHLCLCINCVYMLPDPSKCPMCRSHVVKFMKVYLM